MPKERNKADGYREKAPIKREKSDVFIDSSEQGQARQLAHFGGNFIDIGCYRWQHWCIAGYASLASQDDA